jgi:hypothetical protein
MSIVDFSRYGRSRWSAPVEEMEVVDSSGGAGRVLFVDSTRQRRRTPEADPVGLSDGQSSRVFAIVGMSSREEAQRLMDALNRSALEKPDKQDKAELRKARALAKLDAKNKAAIEKAQEGWSCGACTFLNGNLSSAKCDVCQTARAAAAEEGTGPSKATRKEVDVSLLNGLSACFLDEVKPMLRPDPVWTGASPVARGIGDGKELAVTTQLAVETQKSIDCASTDLPAAPTRSSVLVCLPRLPLHLQAQACGELAKEQPEILVGKSLTILSSQQESDESSGRRRVHSRSAGGLDPGSYEVIEFIASRQQHLIASVQARHGPTTFEVGARVKLAARGERVGDARHGPLSQGDVGVIVSTSDSSVRVEYHRRGWHYQKVALEMAEMPVVLRGDKPANMACHLVDLTSEIFCLDPSSASAHINAPSVIAAPGTHLKQCTVCACKKEMSAFATFCFETAKITGDRERLGAARHQGTVCSGCMKQWCESSVRDGHLYVNCPSVECTRHLQIRELRSFVTPSTFKTLTTRVKEREEEQVQIAAADAETRKTWQKLQIKPCSRCYSLIEKDSGCDDMVCWSCGLGFKWQQAVELPTEAPPKTKRAKTDQAGKKKAARRAGGFSFGGAAPAPTPASAPTRYLSGMGGMPPGMGGMPPGRDTQLRHAEVRRRYQELRHEHAHHGAPSPVGTKICSACSAQAPRSGFSNRQWKLSGLTRKCRGCLK